MTPIAEGARQDGTTEAPWTEESLARFDDAIASARKYAETQAGAYLREHVLLPLIGWSEKARTIHRCESCTHWKFPENDWDFEALSVGLCAAIKMRENIGEEDLAAAGVKYFDDRAGEIREAALRKAKAYCVDGSSYFAAVRTRPDFGCVLWEAKT